MQRCWSIWKVTACSICCPSVCTRSAARAFALDLLPERLQASLETWLKAHPGVQILRRDRAQAYAEGARLGAPQAQQVAERWHLLKNGGDALEPLLLGHHCQLQQATTQMH